MINCIKIVTCGYNLFSLKLKVNIRGMGHTIGNALRRTLLSSGKGWAIIGIKIDKADNELDRLVGIKEDVLSIINNIKKISFMSTKDNIFKVLISVDNDGPILASNLLLPKGAYVLNNNQYICNVGMLARFRAELTVAKDVGYMNILEVQEKYKDYLDGCIVLDANFSPIKRVSFSVPIIENSIDLQDEVELIIESYNITTMASNVNYCCKMLAKCFMSINYGLADLADISSNWINN